MKRRFFAMLLSLAMLFTLAPTAFATDGESGTPVTSGNCGAPNDENVEYTSTVRWSFDSNTGTLTISGNGAMANLNKSTETENISEGAGTYPWANLRDSITNIVIGDGVTSIGSKAFIAYTNVTSVSIGKDVSEIGVGALSQLSACTKFDVSSENSHFTTDATGALFDYSKTKLIAFPCGSSATTYEIPDTVETISYGAFSRAAHLKTITIPADSSLSTIGYGAFAFTTALETVNVIPASVETIGDIPFAQSGVKYIYCADEDTKDRIQNKVNGLLVDVLLPGETQAIEFEENGYTYRIDDDKALLVSAPKNEKTPTVPSEVTCKETKYPVTGIWKGAFAISLDWTEANSSADKRNEKITSVVLPASVTQIGERAFYFCKNLSMITIQANTVSIDKLAFATQNTSGTTVDFSAVTTLQSNGTDKWAGVKEVILNKEDQLDAIKSNVNPNTVAVIGSNKWVMGSDGNWTEQPKKNLTATVDNITWTFDAVGGKATLTAYSSKEATSVTVPSTLTTEDGVTYTVTELGKGLFGWDGNWDAIAGYNTSIKSVVIPKTVTTIGEDMFRYSKNLESVKIQGESITFKSARTFSNTNSLKVLDMSAVKSIAFGTNVDTYFSNMGSNNSSAVIYVSSSDIMSAVETHRSTTSPCYLTYAVTNGGTLKNPPTSNIQLATPVKDGYIFDGWYADSSFSGTAVTAPTAGQTYYAKWSPDSGFCGAESNEKNITWKLTANKEDASTYTLTISGTGDMANLVTLKKDLTVDQNNQPWASAAHQITKLVLNEGITSIGDGAFYDMPLLKSADIPASVKKIGVRAFNWAETMGSLTFAKESKLKEIGYAAFNAIAVSDVTIPASVEKIDKQAFGNDGNLTTVLFEQGSALKEIEENAFFKCGKLTKLILPEGLTTIGNRAFNNENTSLAAVVIPSTVTSFGEEIYNTQNGCLYFANSEVYSHYTKPQTVKCFMGVMNDGTFAPGTVFTTGTLSKPTKTGFKFIGWYSNVELTTPATSFEAGKTYYAKWEEKAEKTAPAAPTLNDRTYTSITLNTIDGAQYRCNGGAWQTSPEFIGLTAGTTYTFEVYYPETDNYKASPASEKVEFSTLRHSSGSSSNPTYSVTTPSKSENGKVSLDKSTAKKGDAVTVTVTPYAGYQLDKLTVTDKDGKELKLTDKGDGQYTFTMPDGKVEIKAVFAKKVETSPFDDVSADAYYNQAVQWAQEKGITDGISSNLFGPKQPCTRSQIVTFLWRAAGSPEPKSTAAGMTDVAPGSYYAKAVAWAVENGITTGTAEGTFSPDATCTRAQAVTFLARAQNAKATGKTAFSDVPADSYFADAVAWAQANGVTTGTSETTFSPDSDCTRAQIVTFLYRANQGT